MSARDVDETVVLEVGAETVRLRPSAPSGEPAEEPRRPPPGPRREHPAGRRFAAGEHPAPPSHPVVLPQISTDPLDELVDRMRPRLRKAVDGLQVAAALEADGCTDRIARVEYGFTDVFALAAEVYSRLGPQIPDEPAPAAAHRGRWERVRVLAHGPLYALPSAVFPAVLAVFGQRSLVLALALAGGLGWMYSGTAAYAAYKLLGAGRLRATARLLAGTTLGAPLAGAVAGVVVVVSAGGGAALILLTAGQLAYQMAGTVLVFYRQEERLAATMLPAVLAGGAYLLGGPSLRPMAVTIAVAGLIAAFVVALVATRGRGADGEPSGRAVLRAHRSGLAGVTCYGFCSAVLLLHAQAPYLLTRFDVAASVVPLIMVMGFVEWRAERFHRLVVGLTRRIERPAAFRAAVWRLIARDTIACLAVTTVPALALVAWFAATGRLTAGGVLMTAAHVVLGGAYLAGFLLAGFERHVWLCASLLAAVAAHVGVGALLGVSPLFGPPTAVGVDAALHLGSVLALQALFLLGLAPLVGQARYYR
ncbi:hypothetical protein [Actinoplanes awajinensis]|uniref:Uncharacterized protein n=1 Tax=Actinoplanes awajinensis subsp. mycoplanecinus TaxID=135947 RepID=A0A101JJB6_9ACTN|nr:hypothetical protein [Actinoplanes awajinensis]KUL27798.1 hypothetical protein ADL15_33710 [Actinoplanes awajinensis subsp. mycoplanecinus]